MLLSPLSDQLDVLRNKVILSFQPLLMFIQPLVRPHQLILQPCNPLFNPCYFWITIVDMSKVRYVLQAKVAGLTMVMREQVVGLLFG